MRNPYETLGVSTKATPEEIKNAYRDLAKKYHPDLNPGNKGAEARFKDVNAAYEQIGSPEARAKFDRGETANGAAQRHGPFYSNTQRGGGRYTRAFDGGFGTVDDDILRSIFEQMGQEPEQRDLQMEVPISIADAILGGEVKVSIPEGAILLKIPAGVSSGQKLRVPGKGMSNSRSTKRGDLIVSLKIVTPKTLDPEFRRAVQAWRERQQGERRAS